ncbi:hypothetical protein AWC38_SpisGene22641 [Stylophora pistillata]|uniref:Uncharacterized protein n=1 Tax=Stylophora pistillata TaxID=50429 RepID=A0A2B4R7Z8_STYPI|nr:hypothetical protein AWC38_SpisGene22641 [Stylophora pistillata]
MRRRMSEADTKDLDPLWSQGQDFYLLRSTQEDTKLSLERDVDIQLRGKKTVSLPKRPGKKFTTQTEMTNPRDIVEEAKRGKESTTDVELGLNCLHLSPRCEQFKPCIMEESPGESSIMHHDFIPHSKRMNKLTLTAADNAKQGHCVVVEISNTHPGGATSLIYGRKINEEGSGVGEPYQLLTKDLIGYEQTLLHDHLALCRESEENYFADAENSSRESSHLDSVSLSDSKDCGGSFNEISSERIHEDYASDEILCLISFKCSGIQNESIAFVAKLVELLNLKLNCREHCRLYPSPGALQLVDGEDTDDVVDVAGVKMGEPLVITGDYGSNKSHFQAISEGLIPSNGGTHGDEPELYSDPRCNTSLVDSTASSQLEASGQGSECKSTLLVEEHKGGEGEEQIWRRDWAKQDYKVEKWLKVVCAANGVSSGEVTSLLSRSVPLSSGAAHDDELLLLEGLETVRAKSSSNGESVKYGQSSHFYFSHEFSFVL